MTYSYPEYTPSTVIVELSDYIERPRLRNGRAITNQNTLIYVLLNLRALQRVIRKKAQRNPRD